MVDDFVTDNTQALNSIISKATQGDELVLPPGYVSCMSRLLPLPEKVKLCGSGGSGSLVRRFQDSGPFIQVGTQYCSVEDLVIYIGDGFSGGIAIGHIDASPEDGSYHTLLRNITVSSFSTGRWSGGVHFDGTNGAPHYGTRAHHIDGLYLHSCTDYGLFISGGNGIHCSNVLVVEGTWGVWIAGNDVNPSNNIYIDGALECSLLFQFARNCTIKAGPVGLVVMDANSLSCKVDCTSTSEIPRLAGQNNHVVVSPKLWWSSDGVQ